MEDMQQPDTTPDDSMSHGSAQPQQPGQLPQKHSSRKLALFAVGGAMLALLAAGAVYWFALRKTDSAQPQQTANTQQAEKEQASVEAPVVPDATPQTFKSDKLGIELTYRKDWKLKEAADGTLAITSPQISYVGSDGKSKTGVFTVCIRKGATEAQQVTIDKSIATRDSEVIAYAAPAEGQRQYTNLSFVGPKDMFGFFIVTSNTEFKAGAPLLYALQLSADSYLIAGGYGADATGSLAFDSVPKDNMDSDTLTEAINIVKSLKIF